MGRFHRFLLTVRYVRRQTLICSLMVLMGGCLLLEGQTEADCALDALTGSLESHIVLQDEPTAEPPTKTPVPTNTHTPVPTDTNTPVPTDTHTPVPTNTDTPVPTDTDTPLPTDTPRPTDTPTVTPTPIPTDTPKPTRTPTPTKTATRPYAPIIIRFVADRYNVRQGESVELEWEVQGTTTLVEIIPGWEGGVPEVGKVTAYPVASFSYRLHACNQDRCADQSILIQVGPAEPTAPPPPPATPTPIPSPTPRPPRVRQLIDLLASAWPGVCPP